MKRWVVRCVLTESRWVVENGRNASFEDGLGAV